MVLRFNTFGLVKFDCFLTVQVIFLCNKIHTRFIIDFDRKTAYFVDKFLNKLKVHLIKFAKSNIMYIDIEMI